MQYQSMPFRAVLGGLLLAGATFAQEVPAKVSTQREAAVYNGPRTLTSMWIWSDSYTYAPGDALTLRWTVKTNGDLYPYTVFVFRQNNQTGAKTFFPGGADATDIGGNTQAQGFQPAALSDVSKAVLIGSGGRFPALMAPDEPGMHTIVVQLRDYTGTRVLKSSYMKFGVVTKTQTISGDITTDTRLTNDTKWELRGAVFVKNNATLTVEPGTFVFGQPGSQPPSVLVVTQNGRISANGTKSRPIVFTSSQPVGQRKRGDWGGVILLGKARVNVAAGTSDGNASGSFFIEGLTTNPDAAYGGSDDNHNCGSLTYVRVEFAGSILSPNNETNSFTWGGCGKGTVSSHLQASYGLDDSFEWFGGSADAKYLVGGNGADDYVDFQLGYTGRVQYGIFYQSPDARGNRGIEGDNSEYNQAATPASNPTMYNLSFFGSGQAGFDEANSPGIFLRRGARGTFNNMSVSNFFSSCIDVNDAATQAQGDAGNVKMDGVVCWKNNLGGTPADTLAGNIPSATFNLPYAQGQKGNGAGKNFLVANPLFTRPFEYSDPDFSGLFGSPLFRVGAVQPPDDGFFDQSAKFIGGIGDENWTEEWTNFLIESDIQP